MENIIVCGDSFSIGIGCENIKTESYGALLSEAYSLPIVNFSKGSSTNLSIFLQVKYAIENIENIKFLILGMTSSTRVEWFPDDEKSKWPLENIHVNYHQYPPYSPSTYHDVIDNPMGLDKNYNGTMFTENFFGIIDYVENGKKNTPYFEKFKNEDKKIKIIYDYYLNIFDNSIQRTYDNGIICMSHLLLKEKKIKHIILNEFNDFNGIIPEENLLMINWNEISGEYPDKYNSLHTSEVGQKKVFNLIYKKIEENENNNKW